jgi:hypothetical protein
MSESEKRRRGRPAGTGINDDEVLRAIAEMMTREPELRATTALRRINPDVNDASKRRIQAKWKEQGSRLLAAAHARLRQATPVLGKSRSDRIAGRPIGTSLPVELTATQLAALEVARRTAASLDLVAIRTATSLFEAETAWQVYNSPAMRAMREAYDNPAVRAMRELHDSPSMRAVREAQASLGLWRKL